MSAGIKPPAQPPRAMWPQAGAGATARPAWMGKAEAAPAPMFAAAAAATPAAPTAAEIEAIRDDARRQGFASGQADLEAALGHLAGGIAKLTELGRTTTGPWSGELVEMALIIVRELIGREIDLDPRVLADAVERALTAVADERDVIVRLNPADQKLLLAHHASILPEGCRVLPDPNLARGGCAVESRLRVVDAKIETRLEALRAGLAEVLRDAAGQRLAVADAAAVYDEAPAISAAAEATAAADAAVAAGGEDEVDLAAYGLAPEEDDRA